MLEDFGDALSRVAFVFTHWLKSCGFCFVSCMDNVFMYKSFFIMTRNKVSNYNHHYLLLIKYLKLRKTKIQCSSLGSLPHTSLSNFLCLRYRSHLFLRFTCVQMLTSIGHSVEFLMSNIHLSSYA